MFSKWDYYRFVSLHRLKTVQLKQKALSLGVFETSIHNLVFCGCRLNINTVYGQFFYQLLSPSDCFLGGFSMCIDISSVSVVNLHCIQHMSGSLDAASHSHYYTLDAGRCCRPCQSDWYWRWSTATLEQNMKPETSYMLLTQHKKHAKVEPEDQLNIFAPTTPALPLSAAIISGVRPDWSAASTGAS